MQQLRIQTFIFALGMFFCTENALAADMQQTYFSNGALESKIPLEENQPHGWASYYREDGTLRMKTLFKMGIQRMVQEYNESGVIETARELNADEALIRLKEYYSDGALKRELIFRDSEKDAEKHYYDSGPLKMSYTKHGGGTEYYLSGAVKAEFDEIDDIANGKGIVYYESGRVKRRWSKEKESVEHFDRDGYLEFDAQIKDGQFHGWVRTYDQSGTIIKQQYVENGKPVKFEKRSEEEQ